MMIYLLEVLQLLLLAQAKEAVAPAVIPPGVQLVTIDYPGAAKRNQTIFHHDGQLYVFGGTRSLDPRDFRPQSFVDDSFAIDLERHKVRKLKPPPVPMMRCDTVVVGEGKDAIGYAVGGISHDGEGLKLLDGVYRYDFADDTWTPLEVRMPTPRTLCGVTQDRGKLFVFGGWEMDPRKPKRMGPGLSVTRQVLVIDLTGDKPTLAVLAEPTPRERRSFCGVPWHGKFYQTGGLDDGFDYVIDSDVFDLEKRTWATFPPPNKLRVMASMAELGDKLYLAGGFTFGEIPAEGVADPFTENRSLEVFDPAHGKWTMLLEAVPGTPGGSATRMFAHKDRLVVYSIDEKQSGKGYLCFINPNQWK